MQKSIDWLELWRELSQRQEGAWKTNANKNDEDMWVSRAKIFNADVKRRWASPDSSRDFIITKLKENPDWTALDIGGGTGAWSALMAQHARQVTVVEPSSAMRQVLMDNINEANARNVRVVPEKWPDAKVDEHDLTLCSHAMYGLSDFAALIHSIEAVTQHLCVLIMRAPIPEDILCIAARHILGQPYDSPNFQTALNALMQMGIFPNVQMEDTGLWDPWISPSLEEAVAEAKRKLGLKDPCEHDAFLRNLLSAHLVPTEDGRMAWPRSIRTALVYWAPSK
jgi:SAM-dependent methyltransferase